MRRTIWMSLLLLLSTAVFAAEGLLGKMEEGQNQSARPNVIIILSDDVGYSDIGCFGSEIDTPNLDALAQNGVRFTQFYNGMRCCPSRASLISGLYPHQAGIGRMTSYNQGFGYEAQLETRAVTIAEALSGSGYRKYMLGKWHLTLHHHNQADSPKYNWPVQRGFDRFYGTIDGFGSYFDPSSLVRDNQMISSRNDPEYQPAETYYYTDAISDNAVQFIADHHREYADAPFFMYVAYSAAHWPLHARERDIEKYRGRYDRGYQAVQQERFERMKAMGVVNSEWTLPAIQDFNTVRDAPWEASFMEVYAAMIDNMDQGVGRIVKELKSTGDYNNTLILYLQDNGACHEPIGRDHRPAYYAKAYEGVELHAMSDKDLQPYAWPLKWHENKMQWINPMATRDGRPIRSGIGITPGPEDTYMGYGLNWALVCNTPLRRHKNNAHEGGISTPLIAHWPNGIDSKGELRKQPGHMIDIMPTVLELARATYPHVYKGHDILPLEGESLVRAFSSDALHERTFVWEHERKCALRRGDWKIVKDPKGAWELYALDKDRSESNDLSKKNPELLSEMAALWEDEAKRTYILPGPTR